VSINVTAQNEFEELYALTEIAVGAELVLQNIGQSPVAVSNGAAMPTDVEMILEPGQWAASAAGAAGVWVKQYRGERGTALVSVRTRAQYNLLKPFTGVDVGPAGPLGPAGPVGPAGDGSTFTKIADINLSGHRAVKAVSGDRVSLVSSANPADIGLAIAITTGAASADAVANLRAYGEITEPSWSWTPGPVFLGVNGVLTQTAPTTGYVQQIGVALSSTKLMVNIRPPIRLG
jgi:hypothetical protein